MWPLTRPTYRPLAKLAAGASLYRVIDLATLGTNLSAEDILLGQGHCLNVSFYHHEDYSYGG